MAPRTGVCTSQFSPAFACMRPGRAGPCRGMLTPMPDDGLDLGSLGWRARLDVRISGAPAVVRGGVVFVAMLPLVALLAHVGWGGPTSWVTCGVSGGVVVWTVARRWDTTMNPTERRLVTRAVLTGNSTGDPVLDGHALTLLASRRNTPMWLERLMLSLVMLTLAVTAVVTAVVVSPWLLLCFPAVFGLAAGALPYILLRVDDNMAALSDEAAT